MRFYTVLSVLLLAESCCSLLFPAPTDPFRSELFSHNDDLEKAARLREEVESFERFKQEREQAIADQEREAQQVVAAKRQRFSAVVPILKPDGTTVEESVEFPARYNKENESYILAVMAPLPLGMILGESEDMAGCTVVDEIAPDSQAAQAGIQVGDILRACSACRVEMETPTWQLMAGGIGRPKTMRFMYSVDYRPFEEVMEAVGSNRLNPEEQPVVLVLERVGDPPSQ